MRTRSAPAARRAHRAAALREWRRPTARWCWASATTCARTASAAVIGALRRHRLGAHRGDRGGRAGRRPVRGVSMPSRYSSEGSRDDAKTLAENLGIRYLTLPIEPFSPPCWRSCAEPFERIPAVVDAARGEPAGAHSRQSVDGALESLRRDCADDGQQVGDGRRLRDALRRHGRRIRRAQRRLQDAGLRPGALAQRPGGPRSDPREHDDQAALGGAAPDQQDTDSLPPYDVLDPILQAYVEDDRSLDAIVAMGYDAATVRRVMTLVERANTSGARRRRASRSPSARLAATAGCRSPTATPAALRRRARQMRLQKPDAPVRASANGGRHARRGG